jgi:hypothetical protein
MCFLDHIQSHAPEYINSCGLILDILGAFLVTHEFVNQFKGQTHVVPDSVVIGISTTSEQIMKTNEYHNCGKNTSHQ